MWPAAAAVSSSFGSILGLSISLLKRITVFVDQVDSTHHDKGVFKGIKQ
jgi:hypothetical protein